MILGHQKIWQFLLKSAELGKLSHAYLFSGPEKLGKKTLAIEFVKWLFKADIQKRQHPDFIFIQPVGKEIQISQIRDLIWRLSLKPSLAPFKIAIIDQAHSMNQESQNCFLKTLEEPKGNTILILITEYPETLFPTILSRCQIVKFYPVSKAEIENYLRNQNLVDEAVASSPPFAKARVVDEKIKKILEISEGKPGTAIDFLADLQKLEMRNQREKELIEILNYDLASRFQYLKKISKEPDLKEILNIWLSYFRNILLSKLEGGQKRSISDINQLIDRLKQIQRTNFLISTTNINTRLALEILMLEI